MPQIKFGDRVVGQSDLPYVIAEIGVNHEGSLETAKLLIESAKRGGADAAKFQTYKAGLIASKFSPSYWDTSQEPTTSQYELFTKYDAFGEAEYKELAAHCKKHEIEFVSTPFDLGAVDMLNPLVRYFKVASADITNPPLLKKV
ncbi:MAG: N-acetylneuraminate synthase family protein, partial [Acidimicrobiaceae bacterium]